MEGSREYFEARAAQCRRLAESVGDIRTREQLTELALEFDAKARDAERAASQDSRLGVFTR